MEHKLKNGAEAHTLTNEERAKGGTNKGVNHQVAKLFKDYISEELEKPMIVNGVEVPKKQAISMKLVHRMLNEEISAKDFLKALEIARDTIGEKPIEKVELNQIDDDTRQQVDELIKKCQNEKK